MKTRSRQARAWLWPNVDLERLLNFPEEMSSNSLAKSFNLDDSSSRFLCDLHANDQSNEGVVRTCNLFHPLTPALVSRRIEKSVKRHQVTAVCCPLLVRNRVQGSSQA